MTAFLQTCTSFLAIAVLAAFAARQTKLPAGLAPLPVVCGVMVWLVLWGYLGLLVPAAIAVLVLAAAALGWMLATARRGGFRKLLAPGFVVFCLASLGFLTLFAVRQPVAQGWDEFSLWATAVKLTKLNGVIYSSAEIGWPWTGTQKPGLPTFAYFFNLLGSYAAWRIYAAYAVLAAAVWSAFLGAFSWKHWKLVAAGTLMLFLLPYFSVYTRDIYCNFTYISAYADIPMGVLAGGTLAWYFHAAAGARFPRTQPAAFCEQRALPLWPLCAMTAAIVLCKDTGLPLACIVAGVIGVDVLFAGGEEKPASLRVAGPKLGLIAGMFAAAGGVFWASSRYLASLGAAQGSVGGDSNMSYFTMLVEGARGLLGLAPGKAGQPYAEKFAVIKAEMIRLFLPGEDSRITMIGCGLFVLLFIWGILAVCALLTTDRLHRRSCVLYGVFSTLGFFAYYIFIGFTYVYVFKAAGTSSIQDYNRYTNTYFALWLGGALALLLLGAAKGSRARGSLQSACVLLALVWLVRFNQLVQPQLSVIDYPDTVYDEVNLVHARADAVKETIEPGSRVYYINCADTGVNWFRNSYEFLPDLLLYSHGGVDLGDGPIVDAEREKLRAVDPTTPAGNFTGKHMLVAEFAAELALQKCDYVYLDHPYASFFQSYYALFADGGMAGGAAGLPVKTLLYRVEVTGTPQYEPVSVDDVYDYYNEVASDGTLYKNPDGSERVKMVDAAQHVKLVPVAMEEVPGV